MLNCTTLVFKQKHWVTLLPNSIQRSEAKLTASAKLKPWLKPE